MAKKKTTKKKPDYFVIKDKIEYGRSVEIKLEKPLFFIHEDPKTDANFKTDVGKTMGDIASLAKHSLPEFDEGWFIFIMKQHYKWFCVPAEVAENKQNLATFRKNHFEWD